MCDGLRHPEPTLQATALRYAAGDLAPAEATAFEARLADDQSARDALSEAVRLSAAALGQAPPAPHRSYREAIRERLAGWCPAWLSRRAYRGHPFVWAGAGAVAVAACTLVGLSLAGGEPIADAAVRKPASTEPPRAPTETVMVLPPVPHDAEALVSAAPPAPGCTDDCGGSVAEIWAQLSTPEHVEKAHDEELRWRLRLHNAAALHPSRPVHPAGDSREP